MPGDDQAGLGRDFGMLWSGQTVSQLGSMVTTVALPLVVVLWLHGSTFEVGLVEALQWLPTAVISLPVGAWADRRHKRPLLIIANLGQAAAIGSVPVAAALGRLTLGQVLAAALITGLFELVFQVSYGNYLRSLVPDRKLLLGANTRSQAAESASRVGGPGLAGVLVSAFGAPFALAADAVSFVISTAALLTIRTVEPPESRSARTVPYWEAIREGLAFTFRDPLLRNLTLSAGLANMCLTALGTIEIPYLARNLGAPAAAIGAVVAVGSIGGLAGAAVTGRLSRALGDGRVARLALACTAPFGLLLPAAGRGPGLAVFVVGLAFLEGGIVISAIVVNTFRQSYCPHDMLGRVSASMQTLQLGLVPVGALLGGALAAWAGNRGALWILCLANLAPGAWRLMSPRLRQRDLPEEQSLSPGAASSRQPAQ
jgi:MFS family permease